MRPTPPLTSQSNPNERLTTVALAASYDQSARATVFWPLTRMPGWMGKMVCGDRFRRVSEQRDKDQETSEETHLRTNRGSELAELPSVDEEQSSMVPSETTKVERHAYVVTVRQIQLEGRPEEANAWTVERGSFDGRPSRVVEAGEVPALPLAEEAALVQASSDAVGEADLASSVTLDFPGRESTRRSHIRGREQPNLGDASKTLRFLQEAIVRENASRDAEEGKGDGLCQEKCL